jgi:hypothetical protein
MRQKAGRGCLGLVLIVALLVILGYSAFSAFTVWSDLQSGRSQLKSGQVSLDDGIAGSDPRRLRSAGQDLDRARDSFREALAHSRDDVSFRAGARLPYLDEQVNATRKLASIGAHLSAAGQAVVPIGIGLADFKRTYGQGSLTPDKLEAALGSAQSLTSRYQSASHQVAAELRAAHDDRASVNTDRLAPPLKSAYDQVDSALAQADKDLSRFQDVNQLLRQLLGL